MSDLGLLNWAAWQVVRALGIGRARGLALTVSLQAYYTLVASVAKWRHNHYMVEKQKAKTQLVLTDLDWLIVRPSALTNESGLGKAQTFTDIACGVAATIVELLQTPTLNRLILELTGGGMAISEGIGALAIDSAAAAEELIARDSAKHPKNLKETEH
ncbi:NAD(P)H-binding protein [Nodosilinea sp. AN01ver1]|uniref:NAD(P)H-binding protein n=1 Tax=Nodosilinea sp. AN01ver1 TaxID=3423362 RepID=UPI003D31EC8F